MRHIQAARAPYLSGDITLLKSILTADLKFPGHSDHGHHTEAVALTTTVVTPEDPHAPYTEALDLFAIVCMDCMTEPPVRYADDTTPLILATVLHEINV